MSYLGKRNPGDFIIQTGDSLTLQQLLDLILDSLTVNNSATLPAFELLSVAPTGTSFLGVVQGASLWHGSGIEEQYGGTGQTSYNPGDILYSDAPNSLATLPSGAEDQLLKITGGAISWDYDFANVTQVSTSPYTTKITDDYILVDTSSAITINLDASPSVGKEYTIKDVLGSGLTNNITIDGNGNTIDGQATQTINTDYGKLKVVWGGSEWSVV